MADLREIPPGPPPWVADPWWVWATRGALAAVAVVFVAGSLGGAAIAIVRTFAP